MRVKERTTTGGGGAFLFIIMRLCAQRSSLSIAVSQEDGGCRGPPAAAPAVGAKRYDISRGADNQRRHHCRRALHQPRYCGGLTFSHDFVPIKTGQTPRLQNNNDNLIFFAHDASKCLNHAAPPSPPLQHVAPPHASRWRAALEANVCGSAARADADVGTLASNSAGVAVIMPSTSGPAAAAEKSSAPTSAAGTCARGAGEKAADAVETFAI
jgi:hypothetical protein